ncbi:hypothetical protein EJ08DRAFT_729676 [Tothia fuscella]|uniref:Uncharacterized protein n=1 Tax=Tothia fuscella TaxID=1048955 RepID=A0A9P4P367_9PEZI|nr:hypothetical protein EJ08DRAFT_729676 [Tothia fuscella]
MATEHIDSSTTPPTSNAKNEMMSTPRTGPGTSITSGQRQAREDDDERVQDEDEDEEMDPQAKIEDFDWHGLENDYHDMVEKQGENELKLFEEFQNLVQYFGVWAATTHNHEVDRSFQRLKTRKYHVQNSELELEKKRLHYINVVKAFENAVGLVPSSPRRSHNSHRSVTRLAAPVSAPVLTAFGVPVFTAQPVRTLISASLGGVTIKLTAMQREKQKAELSTVMPEWDNWHPARCALL